MLLAIGRYTRQFLPLNTKSPGNLNKPSRPSINKIAPASAIKTPVRINSLPICWGPNSITSSVVRPRLIYNSIYFFTRRFDFSGYLLSLVCVPSQYGGFFVCLQPHKATFFASVNFISTGVIPVLSRACEPSQNGWFAE
jgi:hypothetical protein